MESSRKLQTRMSEGSHAVATGPSDKDTLQTG